MTPGQSGRFDELVEEAIGELPERIAALLEEMPVVVLDRPDAAMLKDLGLDPNDEAAAGEICGLHTGFSNTELGIESQGVLPSQVHLFRDGIVALAGGWAGPEAEDLIYEQIMVTLLHEIGHQMGLDEDDLTELGYD